MNWLWGIIGAFIFGLGVFVGRLTVEVPQLRAETKADTAAIHQEAKTLQTDTNSEAQYVEDIQAPPPLVIKQPVWLHDLCPAVSVPAPASGPPAPAAGGTVDPGPSVDLRPQLAEFAKKYEAVIAGCREGARDWPHVVP